MHINAFGADEAGKAELGGEVFSESLLVVDDRDLSLSDGVLNVAAGAGRLRGDVVHAEIGEVLAGARAGRTSDEQVTVFGSVGLAFQDLVACQLIYERAAASGSGVWVSLL